MRQLDPPQPASPAPVGVADPRRRPGLGGWLLMLPMLAWLLLFVVAPTAIMLVYSFCDRDDLGEVQYTFTWENYQRVFDPSYLGLFLRGALAGVAGAGAMLVCRVSCLAANKAMDEFRKPWRTERRLASLGFYIALCVYCHYQIPRLDEDATYLKILWRSVEYAGLTTAICLLAGYPVAYWIGRSPERWRNRLLVAVMIPFWTNFLIRTYAWITILTHDGVLNGAFKAVGLVPHVFGQPLELLYTPTAVIIGLVYSYLPFMILPIYGSVEKLDPSLLEAALDLGAGPLRAFWRVILPLTRAGVAAGAMLVFVPSVGMFAVTDLMGGNKVPMIGNIIQDQFTGQARDWPFGSALGITLLVLFVIAYLAGARGSGEAKEG
jgi:spermidine/putrescine transport system permease protein